jgi:hypothetical protein
MERYFEKSAKKQNKALTLWNGLLCFKKYTYINLGLILMLSTACC